MVTTQKLNNAFKALEKANLIEDEDNTSSAQKQNAITIAQKQIYDIIPKNIKEQLAIPILKNVNISAPNNDNTKFREQLIKGKNDFYLDIGNNKSIKYSDFISIASDNYINALRLELKKSSSA